MVTCCQRALRAPAAGAISAQWKGALTGRSTARLAPLALALGHGALDRGLVPGDDDLAAAIVIGDGADLVPGRGRGDLADGVGIEADDAPPSRLRRPAPRAASPRRGCGGAAPRRRG